MFARKTEFFFSPRLHIEHISTALNVAHRHCPRSPRSPAGSAPGEAAEAFPVTSGRAPAVDDKRFVFLRETSPNERNQLIVVQNWTQEMQVRARK